MDVIAFPSNFEFLKQHDPIFMQLAIGAERAFSSDPNTTLIKLRQLGEALAQDLATRCGIEFDQQTKQNDLLYQLQRDLNLDSNIKNIFHLLRMEGNKATHQFKTSHREALDALKLARSLCVWYHRSFGKNASNFKPSAFVSPPDPSYQLQALQQQIHQLSQQLNDANLQTAAQEKLTKLQAEEKTEYQQLAELMDAEARQLAEQKQQQEQLLACERQQFEQRIQQLQAELNKEQTSTTLAVPKTKPRLMAFIPNEDDARILIDEQLRQAGWQVDSKTMTQKLGERPEKGKNKAIAEWTTANGRADYILFIGLIPVASVEAKRENTNVAGRIQQAERYAQSFSIVDDMQPAWEITRRTSAWKHEQSSYQLPFVYSCNGRPFIPQLPEQSGIWFRDTRKPGNTARHLQEFHSPAGLLDLLKRDIDTAQQQLAQESFAYLKLRNYQEKAIQAVEQRLSEGQRACLLAMATGTGKTRTIIGLIYRFLKTERFKRILFLVDRTALGDQALDSFKEMPLEQNQTLSKIYNIAELGDMAVEAETRVQVATVQAMVKRIFQSDSNIPIDQYDCIIVDEAHRGYTLDQDMTEGELAVRDVSQYLSSYRRVLDYFDAIKIGLTATPAKHTSDIFGHPVYTYSYREAVADDWLIDYEPPIRYQTLLAQNGIHFNKGDSVAAIDTSTGKVDTSELDDELNFEVTAFNRQVITEGFNQVICEQLVQEIVPNSLEKTMIFCATDLHADMVKRLLDAAFKDLYGDDYHEAAVRKITGQSDKVSQLIRQFKNEKYPSIAITVDLLTTGIDVPPICHLVFLRRVKSRILFEQMIGRATRRCDEIGKTVFKVYDPVDLFATLQEVNTMKPLVKDPNISIEQLISELTNDELLQSAQSIEGTPVGEAHAQAVLEQLSQKLMRVLRKANSEAERKPEVKQKLNELEQAWGVAPELLHQHLHQIGVSEATRFLKQHVNLVMQLAEVKDLLGSSYMPVIYEGKDQLVSREQSFGEHQRPDDYLQGFDEFIKNNLNQSVALSVVASRPRELTRHTLREVKLLLDSHGYSEVNLQSAWRSKTSQDIAASIVGHIRRAALGEALIPFEQRVNQAMQHIYTSQTWTPVQRQWLERLAKQLKHESVVDRQFVNERFADQGGAMRFDKVLQNQLDPVLEQVNEWLWSS